MASLPRTKTIGRRIGRLGWIMPALMVGGLWVGSWAAPVAAASAPEEKMDCRVYETKTTNFNMGLRFGVMLLPLLGPLSPQGSMTPMMGFDRKTGVAWDKAVHGLVARYVELCTRYNAGLVDKAEYEARMKEIESVYRDAQELEPKLYEATRQHAKAASDDLNRELSRRKAAPAEPHPGAAGAGNESLKASIQDFSERVDRLEPAGRAMSPGASPLPPDPTKPSATTGTVGAAPEDSIRQP
jgi:hypothetical protein